MHKRSDTASAPGNIIAAKVSVHTETLVISSVALFLSVTIIAILLICTVIIYLVQNSQLRLLPRDFDSPAGLLATVYASEKLKGWAVQNLDRQSVAQKRTWREKIKNNSDDEPVAASMGYFIGIDGNEHWGIELVDEHLPLLADEVAEDAEVLSQAQDELQVQRASQDDAAPRDDTIPQVQTIQQTPGPSQDEDSPQTQAGGSAFWRATNNRRHRGNSITRGE
jgi:hypothetical protein